MKGSDRYRLLLCAGVIPKCTASVQSKYLQGGASRETADIALFEDSIHAKW